MEFPEIDFEESEQTLAKRSFDIEHEGHTYLCYGDIWREVRPESPCSTIDGKVKRENLHCKRCTDSLDGQVWVCELCNAGQRDTVICDDCYEEFETVRITQARQEAAKNLFQMWLEDGDLERQLTILDGSTYST